MPRWRRCIARWYSRNLKGGSAKVFVHEGEAVKQGQVLAEMDAWERRSAVAAAEAKYQAALLQMNHALATNDGGEAGIQRVQADYWKGGVGARGGVAGASATARADRWSDGDSACRYVRGAAVAVRGNVRGNCGYVECDGGCGD